MKLTQKETSLLSDLKSQEQICIEKYKKYSCEACDENLKNLLNQISQKEQQHFDSITQIISGTVPQTNSSSGGGQQDLLQQTTSMVSKCNEQDKQKDKYLCSDLLATEKYVSSVYDMSIFEFTKKDLRNVLNHIQKEEQEHGEMIYNYMSANGMYQTQ